MNAPRAKFRPFRAERGAKIFDVAFKIPRKFRPFRAERGAKSFDFAFKFNRKFKPFRAERGAKILPSNSGPAPVKVCVDRITSCRICALPPPPSLSLRHAPVGRPARRLARPRTQRSPPHPPRPLVYNTLYEKSFGNKNKSGHSACKVAHYLDTYKLICNLQPA